MITCILMGGLGNQLFQIFTLIAHSINTNQKFILPEKLSESVQRHTYWSSIFVNLQKYISNTDTLVNWNEYNEPNFHYNKLPLSADNLILHGYFQSYKYFDNEWKQISNIIGFNKQIEQTKTKYSNYFNQDCVISMHFRLGDYVNSQYHLTLDYNYYEKSIELIINKTNINNFTVLYFCEENDVQTVDLIIINLQNKFLELKFIKINFTICDWEQMLLMSLCNHNIIANSTFSWWGAYIGYKLNEDKIVCYPSKWFGPFLSHNKTDDLFLDKWIKI